MDSFLSDAFDQRRAGGNREHTVSNYLFRVYNKLGISSRVELVLHVMKQRETGESLNTTA